jgi:hypothetical protein
MFARVITGLFLLAVPLTSAWAKPKSFDGIACDSPIATALLGRQMPNDKVVAIEKRYKTVALKALGAHGMEAQGDPWTLSFWSVCGKEYVLLERRAMVRDVLPSPMATDAEPSQIETCTVDGKKVELAVVFRPKDGLPKQAVRAWRVDGASLKFVELQGKVLRCEPEK